MTGFVQKNHLDYFINTVENHLDNVVEEGDDQALFVASYLQGHFAVVVGQSQIQQLSDIGQFSELMSSSLTQAFMNKELDEEDQKQVMDLWQFFLAN